MGRPHLVKIGMFATVGRFESADFVAYSRDERVVCRTDRGLEIGEVLRPIDDEQLESNGQLLRRVSPDDQLIVTRIERFRDRAFDACNQLLQERKINAVLMDVEHLFDGQSLYFYFLGEVPEEVHRLTGELSETYERKVRFKKFTETLASGCGPGCGEGASKCSTSGCGSCSIAGGCGAKAK